MAEEIVLPLRFDDTQVLEGLKNVEDQMRSIESTSNDLTDAIAKDMQEGAKASDTFGKSIEETGKSVADTKKDIEDSSKELSEHRKQIVENIKNYKVFGVSLNDIQNKFKLVKTGLIAATRGAFTFSGAMKVVKLAIAATGIGLLVVALGSVVAFFTKTQAGAEKLKVIFAQVGAAVSVVVDRFSAIGKIFSEQGLIKGVLNLGKAFKGINEELRTEIALTKQLQEQSNKLALAEIIFRANTAKTSAEIAKLRQESEDLNLSRDARIAKLSKAAKLEEDLLKNQIGLTKELIKVAVGEIAVPGRAVGLIKILSKEFTTVEQAAADAQFVISQLGISESNIDDLEKFEGLFERLSSAEEKAAQVQLRLQTRINSLSREGSAEAKTAYDARQKAIDEINKALEEQIQLLNEKVTAANLAALEGAEKLFFTYQLAAGEVNAMKDNLINLFEQAGKPLPEDFEQKFARVFKGLNEALSKELKELPENKEFETLSAIFEQEFNRGLEAAFRADGPSISLRDAVNGFFSDLFGGASLEDLQKIEELAVASFGNIADGLTAVTQEQIKQQDILLDALNDRIDAQQEAVNKELQLAQDGFANNLDAERAYLEELQAQRTEAETKRLELAKKAANQQLIIDTATQISSLATAAASIFASEGKKGLLGVLFAIAAITSMFAIFAKAKAQAKTAALAPQLREGAQLQGASHEKGGIPLHVQGNMYEAEGGEWLIGTRPSKEHSAFLNRLNSNEFSGVNLDALVSKRESPINGLVASAMKTHNQRQTVESGMKWVILKEAYLQGSKEIIKAINEQPTAVNGHILTKRGNTLQHKKI